MKANKISLPENPWVLRSLVAGIFLTLAFISVFLFLQGKGGAGGSDLWFNQTVFQEKVGFRLRFPVPYCTTPRLQLYRSRAGRRSSCRLMFCPSEALAISWFSASAMTAACGMRSTLGEKRFSLRKIRLGSKKLWKGIPSLRVRLFMSITLRSFPRRMRFLFIIDLRQSPDVTLARVSGVLSVSLPLLVCQMRSMRRSGMLSWLTPLEVILTPRRAEWRPFILRPSWPAIGRRKASRMCICTMWTGEWRKCMRRSFCVRRILLQVLEGCGTFGFRLQIVAQEASASRSRSVVSLHFVYSFFAHFARNCVTAATVLYRPAVSVRSFRNFCSK